MGEQDRRLERALAKTRDALDRGDPKSAVQSVWAAALIAVQTGEERDLEAVVDLAIAVRDEASGRLRKDAESALAYGRHCLEDARAGVRRGWPLAQLSRHVAERNIKTCPDCAETIKAEAKVCRFCGYRFEASKPVDSSATPE